MSRRPAHRATIILSVILALLPLLFFWRLITPNPPDQMSIAAGDFTGQYFPLRAFAAQEWVRGRVPLWNPYLFGGQPALADIQSGALYPPHVAQALLLGWGGPLLGRQIGFPVKALEWQAILHFSLAAVGTFLLAFHLLKRCGFAPRPARFGALIASLVFTYGGYLTGFPVQQLTILQASAWLPWVLWGLHVAVERANNRPATGSRRAVLAALVWAGLAFALAILAGHPQTVMYIFYLSLAYALFLGVWLPAKSAPRRFRWGRAALLWLAMVTLGAALSAAQLLPTLEFIRRSLRADLSYPAVSAGLPLSELAALLYPGFFGGSPAYVGIVTLALLALALTLGWAQFSSRIKSRAVGQLFFWAGTGLVSLLLAFGNNLFVYPLFYLLAPGFDSVRQQERVFFLFSFAAAMLAGLGAAWLVSPLSKPLRPVFAQFERRLRGVGVIALFVTGLFIYGSTAATARGDAVNLFFGVLWHHLFGLLILGGFLALLLLRPRRWLRRGWGMGLLAAWLGFNLFTVNWQFNLANPADVPGFAPNGVVQFLQAQVGPSAEITGRIASGGLLPGGNSAASVFELEDLTGNTPLQLAEMDYFLQAMPAWRQWQLLNVRYIVANRDIGDAGLRPVFAEGDVRVFEMGDPFERAWLVGQVETAPDVESAVARLLADDFDLRRRAVVMQPLAGPLDSAEGGQVRVQQKSPSRLQLQVQAVGQNLLVISQTFYPGWRVWVDGQPAELLAVNGVQQGVVLPAGAHQVDLRFRPASFVWGAVISGLALLLCAVAPALAAVRRGG
ncbi:MAG: hypothetical protein D6768_13445 [Chloroflexi bacterium]|nr:MAG: hypothetical protein D6768_13445 [Chloroflexota bacterium]